MGVLRQTMCWFRHHIKNDKNYLRVWVDDEIEYGWIEVQLSSQMTVWKKCKYCGVYFV